jgi:aromatic-L-amino-acid decarboxylase
MIPEELEAAIQEDKEKGLKPAIIIASIGTTSTTAIDPLQKIAEIAKKYGIWLHVDAAYAGSALVLPEFRWMIEGISDVDSFVFNPHKWLFTNFDCSVFYVKSKKDLLNTFQLIPEYLKTSVDNDVNNYSDWGIQLGRRFRSLKLWFVIRSFGIEGLREKIRHHITLGEELESWINAQPDFEMMAPRSLNLLCFRFVKPNLPDDKIDWINQEILTRVNRSGKMYITHTKLHSRYVLRFVASQTYVEKKHVWSAWQLILKTKAQILAEESV